MSLSFIGPTGSFERRWIVYAILRDNVQHHLEGGVPGPQFAALHAIGGALAQGEVRVSAPVLHAELERVRPLLERPLLELAVSERTRAVCMLDLPLPAASATMLASSAGWQPPLPAHNPQTLGDVFGSLVVELLRVTEGAAEGDELTVVDS